MGVGTLNPLAPLSCKLFDRGNPCLFVLETLFYQINTGVGTAISETYNPQTKAEYGRGGSVVSLMAGPM